MNNRDIENFDKAIESLRQYRRYELVDEKNRDLLNKIYVDPMDNDAILKLCLKDNTTVLIGRKGTGKSTIFMRMQNELRNRNDILTCYIDVKNIFDRAKRNYTTINYLKFEKKKEIEVYSIQRKFIMDFVTELINEIEKSYNSVWETIKSKLHLSKKNTALKKLQTIKERITNNNHLQSIELQMIQEVSSKINISSTNDIGKEFALEGNISNENLICKYGINSSHATEQRISSFEGDEKEYNRVFARIFEITTIIDDIKSILEEMKLKRLFIILDDYSEIDQNALRMFCDLIVNPLNNNSDNFIKLKISAYPGRVELGELDRQKIDIRYLDYYQLYMYDKRDDMELSAVNYTKRIIEKRLEVYTNRSSEEFFDTTKNSIEEYYKLIFQMTLNVVRHIGLILDYAKDYSIIQGRRITIANINEAAKRFYDERLKMFFMESQTSLMTYEERIERFQLEDLLNSFVKRSKEIKKEIRIGKYEAAIFDKERKNPYCSHFHISPEYEELISSLELNFFISKYNEMSNKSGKKVSIYALNYGLSLYENIRWGKPTGTEHRTYFIETPFNFNPIISGFLKSTVKVECINPECGIQFEISELPQLKRYGMNCPKCRSENSVSEIPLLGEYNNKIKDIEAKENLLEAEQFRFLRLAILRGGEVTAQEMAQELDTTVQKIGWMTKKMEEEYYYLKKDKSGYLVKYIILELGKNLIEA